MSPEELRKEAKVSELLAAVVSYAPDKERLRARAEELRTWADAMEQTDETPEGARADRQGALRVLLAALPRRPRAGTG